MLVKAPQRGSVMAMDDSRPAIAAYRHVASVTDLISIVDADPDLADLLDDSELERARREALTRVRRLSPGEWDPAGAMEPDKHHRGFLIIEGLLSREVDVLGRTCVELLGAGRCPATVALGFRRLTRARRGRLDRARADATGRPGPRFGLRMNPWPQLGVELFARGTRRAHHLAVALAIAHHQRVDDRLVLTLWHLAERWGRVRSDGIVVPLPLSHQRLADLVGAHRPSVTTAMGELARSGAVSRAGDRMWILHGSPPAQLRHHRLVAAMT